MNTIYITQENCKVHRCQEHLILRKEGRSIATIPLINVNSIIIYGHIEITSYALELLFNKNINVIYSSKNGRIKGSINAQAGGGAVVRLAQYNAFIDKDFRLSVAKAMIKGKIQNQKRLIEKYKRYYSLTEFDESINRMSLFAEKLDDATTTEKIMGIEGVSAKIYWDCYKHLLKDPFFIRRDYRPAPDFVNSALNLGYSFLVNEITSCLVASKFDIEIGFLHSIHYGRNSLSLDIMEEFRSSFIDDWILGLFNRKVLKQVHFKNENDGFYLTDEGFAKFCNLYHEHIDQGRWRDKFMIQSENLKRR